MIKMDNQSTQTNDFSNLNRKIDTAKKIGVAAGSLLAVGGFLLTNVPKAVKAVGSLRKKK